MVSIKLTIIYSTSILFFTLVCLLYILGVAKYITDFEENTCEMTYMFEYPQYVRISLKNDIEKKYPRYALYAYGEGFVTEKLRRMHFTGIPVLFIPGNAGSHQQVRSIASVSLRKSLKNRTPFHFDFFTVSFNKDYSALYGGVLMEQAFYVAHCIKAILALYKSKIDSVVLIGHSMGGIIAKGALLLAPDMNASFASMILNLATPHVPVLALDSGFATYYHELEKRLDMIKDAGTKVVSIGGGPRDILVPAIHTFDPTADINVLSTSVPAVWKSTDHLSILWCKQLVLAIVRSLFDSVDTNKLPRITSNPDLKMQALSYHFLQHTSGKKLYHYKEKIQFENNSEWITIVPQQYVWNNKNVHKKSTIYLVMKLLHESDFLTIDAMNLANKDWLFVCTASKMQEQKKTCEWGWNLTNRTRILPDPLHRTRRIVDLNLKKINYPDITHIVVKITPDDLEKHLTVSFDSYFYENRVESTNKFMHLTYLLGFREYDFIKTANGSVRYYVMLPNIMDAVVIEVKSLNCIDKKQHAIVELIEPWNMGATQSRFFTNTDDGPKTMKIQTLYIYGHSNNTAMLRLTLDSECLYAVHVQPGGIIDKISCRVRDRWPLLYIAIISLLLLFLSARIDPESRIMPMIVVTVVLSFSLNVIYEVCVALCIIGLSAVGVCFSIIFFGSVIKHKIVTRLLSRIIAVVHPWLHIIDNLIDIPFITIIFILPIYITICGALATIISLLFYFIRLTRMYEDYLEELLMASFQHFSWLRRFKRTRNEERNDRSSRQNIYNHLVLFLLFSFAAIAAIPSVLVWAKNFSYDIRLTTEDRLFFLVWMTLAMIIALDIAKYMPECKERYSLIISNFIRLESWILLSTTVFSPQYGYFLWYIPPFVSVATTVIIIFPFVNHINDGIFHLLFH